jgi:hypothetical protein
VPSDPDPEKPESAKPDAPATKPEGVPDDDVLSAAIPAAVAAEIASPTASPIVISTVGASGAIETSKSGPIEVAKSAPIDSSQSATSSGSIEVALSLPKLPKVDNDGTPVEVASAHDSAPVSSGRVTSMTVAATGPTEARSKRTIKEVGKDMLDASVSSIGSGIESLGEGVSKLGEASRKVPVVGSSVSRLGEGLSAVGESIHDLPRVARTRRGALLVRSLLVGFVLVFGWIAVIVLLQVRGTDSPDFRPHAERILQQLSQSKDKIEELYEKASPRFQEVVRKERFVDDMLDLKDTAGTFLEITSINESIVTSGPTGRIGRMSMMVQYSKGKTRAAVSLHWVDDEWKLLGVSVEVPPELKITQTDREKRVAVCEEMVVDGKKQPLPLGPMNATGCEFHVSANRVLEQLRDNRAGQVWEEASKVFKDTEQRGRFVVIQTEYQRVLGEYRRIIRVTEGKQTGGTRAFFDVIAQYSRASVRVIFGFERKKESDPWQLRSLKIALPMPRVDDFVVPEHGKPTAGSGSGSAKAGSGSAGKGAGSASRPPVTRPGAGSARTGVGSAARPGSGSATTGSGSATGSGSTTGSGSASKTGSGFGSGSGS